ncbi:MAG: 4-alpha-glucanotransferase, partial [Acidobacteria bacterium]|nr:4-alpha-glucanotransferase [Acidobacteriota bacterium]
RELGFEWWIERLRTQASLTDQLRLDHFRGFLAYWRVPAAASDARDGRWARGPGRRLFTAVAAELPELSLIAEDLGLITPAVHRLRRRLGLPGMKVLQFGFGEVDSDHLPHHYEARCVVYTGTHDNDTLSGWFDTLDRDARRRVLDHLGLREPVRSLEVSWHLIRVAMESVAELAIVPLQDVLGLGSEGRMNTPGTVYGNWRWRMTAGALDDSLIERLRRLVRLSGRLGDHGATTRSE